jgi:hypothetical protein
MKKYYIFLIISLVGFFLSSCEEEVILDLNDIEKRIIVEAVIANDIPFAKVTLSYSMGFYDDIQVENIPDAVVKISSENGESELLKWDETGFYFSTELKPVYNSTYNLYIEIGDKIIETATTLPEPVKIKQIVQAPNQFRNYPDSLNVIVSVDDPVGQDNFFRLKVNKINKVQRRDFYFTDDTFGKDGTLTMPVYYKNFAKGDTVIVELMHTTRETSEYYNMLNENIRGSFNSIAPGNPVSNMPPDIYGLFSAYGITRDTIIIGAFPFIPGM